MTGMTVTEMIHAKAEYSPETIDQLETAIQNGDSTMFKCYTDDALRYHLNNKQELIRRKRFMAMHWAGTSQGMYCFALLCALTDDREGWDIALDAFAGKPSPRLGFAAHSLLRQQGADEALLAKWNHLLTLSASQGHLQAKRIVREMALNRLGIFRFPLVLLNRLWIGLSFLGIFFRNPSDDRLPFREYPDNGIRSNPPDKGG